MYIFFNLRKNNIYKNMSCANLVNKLAYELCKLKKRVSALENRNAPMVRPAVKVFTKAEPKEVKVKAPEMTLNAVKKAIVKRNEPSGLTTLANYIEKTQESKPRAVSDDYLKFLQNLLE